MSQNLSGKVVLVTGGAKRIGAAIARQFHASDARLMLHYHTARAEAQVLQAELNGVHPESVATVQADLNRSAALPEIVEAAVTRFGRLDVVVNNASTFYPTPVGSITEEAWNDLMGVNVRAPLFLSQAAAPYLRKTGGCIVNIVDIHADRPLKDYVVYSVAKAALVGLTRSLARELGPEVRVNAVAPGPVLWPDSHAFDELAQQRIVSHTVLKRVGAPEDVARAVVFLAAEAPYVTGQVLAVDGGRSINL
ncbi:MAG TPA: pteridine reductase [Burkholderiales bacterium]|nr:pteridine reductase [Burkholderiales bacterium]